MLAGPVQLQPHSAAARPAHHDLTVATGAPGVRRVGVNVEPTNPVRKQSRGKENCSCISESLYIGWGRVGAGAGRVGAGAAGSRGQGAGGSRK